MTSAFGVTYRSRPSGRTGSVARWCVAVHAAALVFGGAFAIQLVTSDEEWSLSGGGATAGGAYVIGPFIGPIRIVLTIQAVTLLFAMVGWLWWQSRAHENVWAARAGGRITPAWAVLWWFVPFANMVKPATAVGELLRGSAHLSHERGHDGVMRAVWWTLFLSGQITAYVGLIVLFVQTISTADLRFSATTVGAEDIRAGLWITAVGFLLQAAAAVPAIAIVRTVDRRLARSALDGAGAMTGLPAEPSVPARPDLG
jgi:hypothetical protein